MLAFFPLLALVSVALVASADAFAVGTNKRIFRRGDSARSPLRLHARSDSGIGASVLGVSTVAQIGTGEATVVGAYAGVTTIKAAAARASATGLVTAAADHDFGGIGIKLVSTTLVPAPSLLPAVAVVGSSGPSISAAVSSSSGEKASTSTKEPTSTTKANVAEATRTKTRTRTVFRTRTETVTVSA